MKVLVIGGTGHIGSYLIPRLVRGGHEVTVVARTAAPKYADERLFWPAVEWVLADRREEEKTDAWAKRMAGLSADVVIDMICFTPEQQAVMTEAFQGRVDHFLHCGTIWAYGPADQAPYEEHFVRKPITDYGIMKAQIEAQLLAAWRHEGFPATLIHPGHICGRRWLPIDPQGTRDGVGVYRKLAAGEPVQLPDLGLATLHHVHADDVAQLFERAMIRREQSVGEMFSAVAPYAMSLRGCCYCVAQMFNREANLEFVALEALRGSMGEQAFATTKTHVEHSPCSSIKKGQRLLGYEPRYTTEQIYAECVEHLLESRTLVLQ